MQPVHFLEVEEIIFFIIGCGEAFPDSQTALHCQSVAEAQCALFLGELTSPGWRFIVFVSFYYIFSNPPFYPLPILMSEIQF